MCTYHTYHFRCGHDQLWKKSPCVIARYHRDKDGRPICLQPDQVTEEVYYQKMACSPDCEARLTAAETASRGEGHGPRQEQHQDIDMQQ